VSPETELPGGVGQWFVAVMLYCVAMCFTVLQLTFGGAGRHPFKKEVYYVAACCSVLQCAAACCSVLQPIFGGPSGRPYKGRAVCCVCCSVLQCVAADFWWGRQVGALTKEVATLNATNASIGTVCERERERERKRPHKKKDAPTQEVATLSLMCVLQCVAVFCSVLQCFAARRWRPLTQPARVWVRK